jgi:hypothetical protein
MVAYGLLRDGSAMAYNMMRRAHCALRMMKRRITFLCSCVFAREVWHRLLHAIGWQSMTPDPNARLTDWWQLARKRLPGELRWSFDSAVLLPT